MGTAAAPIKGFEVMRMIRRGHCLTCKPRVKEEIRFVNKPFDVFLSQRDRKKQQVKLLPDS